MADLKRRLHTNIAGDFYVDESCIDCATCRWMAPEVFDEAEGASRVHCQPEDESSRLRALQALIACPTASIGTVEKAADMNEAVASFPRRFGPEDLPVFHCGFHAESSFGAASYLIQRPEGNILIDSPRLSEPLAKSLEALGGVALMLLTHRDDVADHARYADRFGCERVMHAADISSGTRAIERVIEGTEATRLADDLEVIPCPGHTRGSVCYLYADRVLFSGDHLAWSDSMKRLYAFRDACWYSWPELVKSMEALRRRDFEWVLPGHGWPVGFSVEEMRQEMGRCVDWVRQR